MKKTVLVDLDATIAKYDHWRGVKTIGPPMIGAKEFLEELRKEFKVVIYTTRCNPDVNEGYTLIELAQNIKDYMEIHHLPYDDIAFFKPIAIAIIDDRAVPCRPMDSLDKRTVYNATLERVRQLAKK